MFRVSVSKFIPKLISWNNAPILSIRNQFRRYPFILLKKALPFHIRGIHRDVLWYKTDFYCEIKKVSYHYPCQSASFPEGWVIS